MISRYWSDESDFTNPFIVRVVTENAQEDPERTLWILEDISKDLEIIIQCQSLPPPLHEMMCEFQEHLMQAIKQLKDTRYYNNDGGKND